VGASPAKVRILPTETLNYQALGRRDLIHKLSEQPKSLEANLGFVLSREKE
jgi:hypothetical protein